MDLRGTEKGPVEGSCKNGNKRSCSLKSGKFA